MPASTCCIVCSGGRIPVQRLDVMKVGKAKSNKRKRPKVREIDINSSLEDNIRETLRKERLEYMMKNCPHMAMIGTSALLRPGSVWDAWYLLTT